MKNNKSIKKTSWIILLQTLATSVLCDRGHANGPEPDVLKNVVCKNEHGAKAGTPLCKKSIFERSGFA